MNPTTEDQRPNAAESTHHLEPLAGDQLACDQLATPEQSGTNVKRPKGILVPSEAIQVVFLTAMAYAGAHEYERAICSYFGIPYAFMVLTTQSLVSGAISLIPLFLLAILLGTYRLLTRELKQTRLLAAFMVVVFLYFLIWFPLIYFRWAGHLMSSIRVATRLYAVFLVCLVLGGGWLLVRLARDRKLNNESSLRRKITRPFDPSTEKIAWLIAYATGGVVFTLPLCHEAGIRDATHESTYAVLEDTKEIVLRRYGEVFVVARVSGDDRLTGEFRLVRDADLGKVRSRRARIRPREIDTELLSPSFNLP